MSTWLTAEEAAEYLGVSVKHVRRHAAALGAVKLGTGRNAPLRFKASIIDSRILTAYQLDPDAQLTPPPPRSDERCHLLAVRTRHEGDPTSRRTAMWVEQLKSGKWRGCFRDADGRVHRRTHLRKTDAKNWAIDQEARIKRGDWIDPALGRTSFSDWAQNVMAAR